MKFTFLILLLALCLPSLNAQVIELRKEHFVPDGSMAGGGEDDKPAEWFNNGRFGFNGDFSTQATAQVLRYRIGEQDGFSLPLHIIASATGVGLGDASEEQITFNNLLSPTGGVLNALVSDSYLLTKLQPGKKTAFSVLGGFGYKLINGRGMNFDSTTNVSTIYADAGLKFTTGAYVEGAPNKNGTFVIQLRAFATTPLGSSDQLEQIFGPDTETWFAGLSGDILLFIDDEIDLRLNVSRSLTQEKIETDDLQRTVVTFGINYSL